MNYKWYRKSDLTPMYDYKPGDSLDGVSVGPDDIPQEGGKIAWNPDDPSDRWYINPEYLQEKYVEVQNGPTLTDDSIPDVK